MPQAMHIPNMSYLAKPRISSNAHCYQTELLFLFLPLFPPPSLLIILFFKYKRNLGCVLSAHSHGLFIFHLSETSVFVFHATAHTANQSSYKFHPKLRFQGSSKSTEVQAHALHVAEPNSNSTAYCPDPSEHRVKNIPVHHYV